MPKCSFRWRLWALNPRWQVVKCLRAQRTFKNQSRFIHQHSDIKEITGHSYIICAFGPAFCGAVPRFLPQRSTRATPQHPDSSISQACGVSGHETVRICEMGFSLVSTVQNPLQMRVVISLGGDCGGLCGPAGPGGFDLVARRLPIQPACSPESTKNP